MNTNLRDCWTPARGRTRWRGMCPMLSTSCPMLQKPAEMAPRFHNSSVDWWALLTYRGSDHTSKHTNGGGTAPPGASRLLLRRLRRRLAAAAVCAAHLLLLHDYRQVWPASDGQPVLGPHVVHPAQAWVANSRCRSSGQAGATSCGTVNAPTTPFPCPAHSGSSLVCKRLHRRHLGDGIHPSKAHLLIQAPARERGARVQFA